MVLTMWCALLGLGKDVGTTCQRFVGLKNARVKNPSRLVVTSLWIVGETSLWIVGKFWIVGSCLPHLSMTVQSAGFDNDACKEVARTGGNRFDDEVLAQRADVCSRDRVDKTVDIALAVVAVLSFGAKAFLG